METDRGKWIYAMDLKSLEGFGIRTMELTYYAVEYWILGYSGRHIGRGDLKLESYFQWGHSWTEEEDVSFIEFLLRGGWMTSPLMFNRNADGMVIVDGLQRLKAFDRFFLDNLVVLRDEDPEGIGYVSSQIGTNPPGVDTYGGNDLNLIKFGRYHINNLKTRREILEWYKRTNSPECVRHSPEEISRAMELCEKEEATDAKVT